MDEYLTEMETAHTFEDIGVPLPKAVVVWYTISNLPHDYDITKQMILGNPKLSTYAELEMRFLTKEPSRRVQKPV